MLSVYSPSDRDHYFRDHRFDDDNKTYYDYPPKYHHDPYHSWYEGEQVVPSLGAKRRLFGQPLCLDFRSIGATDIRSLPKVDFVTRLIIPRQFYRPIPNMDVILRSLPELTTFRYEPWYPITTDRAWLHESDFMAILAALPPKVTRFSGYKDSNAVLNAGITEKIYPNPGLKLFDISKRLKELDISFLIDARSFFIHFTKIEKKDKTSWDNLEGLTITSNVFSPRPKTTDVDELLIAASQAAYRMPKLQMMELWSGKRGEARIFRYTRLEDNSLIEWYDSGPLSPYIRPNVRNAWKRVAEKYIRGQLVFKGRKIPHQAIRSRASVLPYLIRRDRTLTCGSLQQILWETAQLKRVRDRAPLDITTAHTV
ncbi:hypothetical protein F5B19DRAFT_382671 [Rostrohypoxylon terebratum]|nr:hypothetical protein F5B19DRAFT_382671 [Rostrohypoxylon terebratum]